MRWGVEGRVDQRGALKLLVEKPEEFVAGFEDHFLLWLLLPASGLDAEPAEAVDVDVVPLKEGLVHAVSDDADDFVELGRGEVYVVLNLSNDVTFSLGLDLPFLTATGWCFCFCQNLCLLCVGRVG